MGERARERTSKKGRDGRNRPCVCKRDVLERGGKERESGGRARGVKGEFVRKKLEGKGTFRSTTTGYRSAQS